MATILTKKKDTSGAPSAGDLTNSTGGAELAVNTADKRLYTKDSGGNVVEVGINPTSITTGTLNTSGAVVFNDAGADVDFRVEGDTDANLLFVDASTDRVGIGTASPAVAFDVVGQVRASTGILFGTDTAAANALDDYEEGTFTPTIGASTTDPTGVTYTTQNGQYLKIGNLVYIRCAIATSAGSGGSGFTIIKGLPFTNGFGDTPISPGQWGGINITGNLQFVPKVQSTNNYITLIVNSATTPSTYDIASVTFASLILIFTGVYRVA